VEPWMPEPVAGLSTQYDLSRAKVALLLAVIQGRPGAQHDVEALGRLCQTLGFETTLRMDPTAQAFQKELAQFREQLDTHSSPVSCALVALMAHGGPQGQLVGADGQEVQLEVLKQELSHCRALQDHPKIFLLQACRGGSRHRRQPPISTKYNYLPFFIPGNRDTGVGPTALPWYWRWLQAPPAIPSHADVLQIYADAKGYVAYRDEKGSDFIQTLVEVLQANPGRDLMELLTEVNRQICEHDVLGPDGDELRKACLEIRSSLRHRLCLQ
uniref:Caspase 14 n=1 Tax=Otolemur garnettii TaxID=30611 RepID=H0WN97_OTOGA